MTSNPKKYHLLILVGFVVYPFLIAGIAPSIYDIELFPISVPKSIFDVMKAISIVFSIITIVVPWLIYIGVFPFQPSNSTILNRISPEYKALILGYIFLVCPVIYGLFLVFFGMPLVEFYYYIGVSVVGTFIWGFLNFRNPIGRGPTQRARGRLDSHR